jgi:heme/copper-type cytochrome/quinol oxidase subunit 1
MAHTVLFVACAILAPLFAHIRQWPPAALFAIAALVYAIFGGISFANVQFILSNIQEAEPQVPRDTYYVVNPGHVSMSLGIIMAIVAAVTWLQTRLGAMLYPRITKTLFWILHLGLLGASSFSVILTAFITPPRRYIEYSEYLEAFNLVSTWASIASTIAGLGLICMLIWSVIFRRNAA